MLYTNMNQKRWWITLIIFITFACIVIGIIAAIVNETPVVAEWKELLLLLLGAFIGSFNKAADFWFGKEDKDKLLIEKIDDEDDESVRKDGTV